MAPIMNHEASREETVFHAIMGLSTPQERARYLQQACGDDCGLRRRVEALLQSAQKPEDFLEQPVVESKLSATEAAALEAHGSQALAGITEQPGDRIGAYQLLERIGEGGWGVVYMAEQKEPMRRRVALKVVKLGMDTKDVIARFEAERQALALMDHPNIAKEFEAGATDTGRQYFVMELVRGIKITD